MLDKEGLCGEVRLKVHQALFWKHGLIRRKLYYSEQWSGTPLKADSMISCLVLLRFVLRMMMSSIEFLVASLILG